MKRKLVVANLTIALALVGLGILQARLGGAPSPPTPPTRSVGAGETTTGLPVAGRNLLLVQGFESSLPFVVGQGYAASYGPPSPGSGAFWGRSVARALEGIFSAWCAGDGPSSPAQPPYGANCIPYTPYSGGPCLVPPDTNTTMTLGPYDLTDYTAGQLTFAVWLDTAVTDPFSVQASLDGHHFYGYTYYGATSGPMAVLLVDWPTLGTLAGRPQVWFRFGYSSNAFDLSEGVYVDDIRLEATGVNIIFADSFELGNTSGWSATVP